MTKRDLPVGLFGWCFVILVAAFMPWATSPLFSVFAPVSAVVTGWTGNITLLGIVIPNWLSVALAAALAGIGWFRANSTEIAKKTDFWLALVGTLHSSFFVFSVFTGRGAQLGLGAIATLVAFVAIFRRIRKEEKEGSTPDNSKDDLGSFTSAAPSNTSPQNPTQTNQI